MKIDNKESEPKVLVCLFDLVVWLLQRTNRFPRNWRITLGDRLDSLVLKMLSLAQKASMRKEKHIFLTDLSEFLEEFRMLIRLSLKLKCLELKQYEYASRLIDEIGKQTGGWLKYSRKNEKS